MDLIDFAPRQERPKNTESDAKSPKSIVIPLVFDLNENPVEMLVEA